MLAMGLRGTYYRLSSTPLESSTYALSYAWMSISAGRPLKNWGLDRKFIKVMRLNHWRIHGF